MGFTVKVDHPHFPKGKEFSVIGVGRIPNGDSVVVDEDAERLYMLARGLPLDVAFAGDHAVTVTGTSSLPKNEIEQLTTATPVAPLVVEAPVPPVQVTTNDDGNDGGEN